MSCCRAMSRTVEVPRREVSAHVSCSVDANVLLYSSFDDHPLQGRARELLDQLATGSELLYLAWPVLMAYLRIATHSRVLEQPLTPADAMQNVESLLSRPQVRLLTEGDRFWRDYCRTAEGLHLRGNIVPDAHLATLLRCNDVSVLYTNDADFRRFPFLKVRNPFH